MKRFNRELWLVVDTSRKGYGPKYAIFESEDVARHVLSAWKYYLKIKGKVLKVKVTQV